MSGKILAVKIKRKGAGGVEYKNEINFDDYTQLAILFLDLKMYGAKIEKAISEFNKKKKERFPW